MSNTITLGAVAELNLQGEQVPLFLMISSDRQVSLMVGTRQFAFSQLQNGFIASYNNLDGKPLNVGELIGELIPSIADQLPDNLNLNLEKATIAYQDLRPSKPPAENSTEATSALLFLVHLGFNIDLANLPLIGSKIPSDYKLSLNNFQLTYVSADLNQTAAAHFATDLGLTFDPNASPTDIVLASGVYLSAQLHLNQDTKFLSLPIQVPTPKESKPLKSASPDKDITKTNPSENTLNKIPKSTTFKVNTDSEKAEIWIDLEKSLGPLTFHKIGIQYRMKESELWFFLNASFSFKGLTIACNNLGVGSSIKEFKPKFTLDGIAIHYQGDGEFQISGAFLRKTCIRNNQTSEEYSGAAIIGAKVKGKGLTLTAIGSYTENAGKASLFVFALLDYPLGGPPAFFITGLAAGFGYNRTLVVPKTVEEVAQFPLVRLAMGEKGNAAHDILSILDDIGRYIPPTPDEMFFAIGIKFTSFKLIEAFVLLICKLGKKVEIHVLGFAKLTAPPSLTGLDPVAEACLNLKAVFIPEDGILQVEAALAEGSYIFSKKCYLSGGFAFYAWFSGEHEGDFVLSLGGYHPDFKLPAHYPTVSPVKISWILNDYLAIKGSAYFALTPSALMLGGTLEAVFKKDDVQAYFKIQADFLVGWQPFYYQADMSIEIRASAKIKCIFEFTISINAKANLSIWGPPFAGRAQLEVGPLHVEIQFGEGGPPRPQALTWSEFKTALLPAKEEVCSISISDGLLSKSGEKEQEVWIVNAKELVLVAQSVIPFSTVNTSRLNASMLNASKADLQKFPDDRIGVRPMGLRPNEFTSTCNIFLTKKESGEVSSEFEFQPIKKNVPAAIWQVSSGALPYLPPSCNDEKLVKSALSGFEIRPKNPTKPGASIKIDYKELLSESAEQRNYDWSTIHNPKLNENLKRIDTKIPFKRLMNDSQIPDSLINLLYSLMPNSDTITMTSDFADDLLGDPQLCFLR